MSVVQELRQIVPTRTSIVIVLANETSDADIAGSLLLNRFITNMCVRLAGAARQQWPLLWWAIGTLERISIVGLVDGEEDDSPRAPAALVLAILEACHSNKGIQEVRLSYFHLTAEVCDCIRRNNGGTTRKKLLLHECWMDADDCGGTTALVAALEAPLADALAAMRSIESLELECLQLEFFRNESLVFASALLDKLHSFEQFEEVEAQVHYVPGRNQTRQFVVAHCTLNVSSLFFFSFL